MSFRRVGWVAAVALATLLELSCGQVYRPVVIPVNITPPNSANFHAVFGISANVAFNPGAALQIDVSGDSNIGVANMGINPTHAAILPNNSRVFVASAGGSVCSGGTDVVTAFFPASGSSTATGLGTTTTFSLPNVGTTQPSAITINTISEAGNLVTVGLNAPLTNATVGSQVLISNVVIPQPPPAPPSFAYDGCFKIVTLNGATFQYVNPNSLLPAVSGGTATVPTFCPYLPAYVATAQANAVYVANYGAEGDPNCSLGSTDSIASLNPASNSISNLVYLPPGAHPVAMVETPNGFNLYVLNQGNNTVTDLSPTDLSTITTIPVGNTPAWGVSRLDGQRVYVVTQGDSQLYTINTATNAVLSNQSVGVAGANFVLYDKSRNRLYVTNPNAAAVYVFDATTDPPTPLGNASGIGILAAPLPAGVPPCTTCSTVMPVSVAALPDGSRFYVASYVTAALGSACPDPNVTATGCVIPQVTVFDAGSFAVKTNVFPLLLPVANPVLQVQPFALAPATFCAPVTPYTPSSARFRMSATAAAGSSRVYASMCDGGSVAIINTTTSTLTSGGNNTPDILVTDLPAPFSAATAPPNGEPPPQNPVFLLTGQ